MNKKFDFSAEIESAEVRTNREYRERYEEENKLLKINVLELIKLNDNIYDMRTSLEKLATTINDYQFSISNETLKKTEDLGTSLVRKLSTDLDNQYTKFEARLKKHRYEDGIRVPTRTFYILAICLVSLFCFFICTVAANIHLLNSDLLWKIIGWSIGMATLGIGVVIVVPKLLERSK